MFRINVRYLSLCLLVLLGYPLMVKWNAYQQKAQPESRYQSLAKGSKATQKQLDHLIQAKVSSRIPKENIVMVDTALFQVWINRSGGDIIQTKLKNYKEKLHGTKDVSVLGNAQHGLFDAQSGFSGAKKLNFSSEKSVYTVSPKDNLTVTLNAVNNKGIHYQKRFVFHPHQYTIEVQNSIHNQGKTLWKGAFFMQINRTMNAQWQDLKNGIGRVEDHTPAEKTGLFSSNRFRSYAGPSYYTPEKPYTKLPYNKINTAGNNLSVSVNGGWIAMQQPYFISAWIPKSLKRFHLFAYKDKQTYTMGMRSAAFSLRPNQSETYDAALYAGPEEVNLLKKLAPGLEYTVDYGWLFVLSDPIFKMMQYINDYIHSWGFSIIIITCLIKIVFYKFTESSYRSMINMRKLQPKIQALKEKFGDDKATHNREMSQLMMSNKVNPLSGCLPMLVVFPFFIALYFVLLESVELRHAAFLWIPDLSAKDPLYILPLFYGLSTWVQQRINPQQSDSPQAQAMMMMPLIMTVMFVFFPAGLILYMITNNLFSIAQNFWINKKYKLYEETGFSPMKAILDFRYQG
jgi:YidC/Oxa1 family membrane protein insertase